MLFKSQSSPWAAQEQGTLVSDWMIAILELAVGRTIQPYVVKSKQRYTKADQANQWLKVVESLILKAFQRSPEGVGGLIIGGSNSVRGKRGWREELLALNQSIGFL